MRPEGGVGPGICCQGRQKWAEGLSDRGLWASGTALGGVVEHVALPVGLQVNLPGQGVDRDRCAEELVLVLDHRGNNEGAHSVIPAPG